MNGYKNRIPGLGLTHRTFSEGPVNGGLTHDDIGGEPGRLFTDHHGRTGR